MDQVFPENDDWSNSLPKFSPYEQECIDYIDTLPNGEIECENEKLNYERKLWTYFQSSAMAIAQLYSRDNLSTAHNVWNTFQQASTNVTGLYKESAENHKKNYDIYHQNGYHKRTKEIVSWIKKKKNLIRRDELLGFLSGHNPTYLHNNCYYHRFGRNTRSNRGLNNNLINSEERYPQNSRNNHNNNRFIFGDTSKQQIEIDDLSLNNNNDNNNETNLDTFKEALVSNIKNSAVCIGGNTANKRNSNSIINNNNINQLNDDLNEFVNQQFNRHVESRKRTTPSMDICMDSSNQNKRTRFC